MFSTTREKPFPIARGPAVLLAAFLFSAFLLGQVKLWDFDSLWHLKAGELIVERRALPEKDPFSYTRPDAEWKLDEWGGEAALYLAWKTGGFAVLAGFVGLAVAAAAALALSLAAMKGAHWTFALAFVGLAVFGSRLRLTARPDLFSLLFLLLFLWILERSRERRGVVFALLPLQVVWANLHAGALLGPAAVALHCAAAFLEPAPERRPAAARRRDLALTAAALPFCCLLNPYGTYIYRYALEFSSSPVFTSFIAEWRTQGAEDFFTRAGLKDNWAYKILCFATFAGLAARRFRARTADLLTVALLFALSVKAVRFTGAFSLAAAPVAAAVWSRVAERALRRLDAGKAARAAAVALGGAALLATAFAGVLRGKRFEFGWGLNPRVFPVKAMEYLERLGPEGRMYNDYGFGAYAIWTLWPDRLVFIDGRCPVYGAEFFSRYIEFEKAPSFAAWEAMQDRYGFTTAFLSTEQKAAADILLARPDWEMMYWDDRAAVFLQERHGLFARLSAEAFRTVTPWNARDAVRGYPGMDGAARARVKQEFERALSLNPDNAIALRGAIATLLHDGEKAKALPLIRRYESVAGRTLLSQETRMKKNIDGNHLAK